MERLLEHPRLKEKAERRLPVNRWKDLLLSCAELQDRSIHQPNNLFRNIWVEIGPGYRLSESHGLSFGHWDLVQTAMDALPYDPLYAKVQLENYFSLQYPDGMLPGTVYSKSKDSPDMNIPDEPTCSHPPLWQEFVHDYYALTGDKDFLKKSFNFGKKNLSWWQKNRTAPEGGFYYIDLVKKQWESGVDAGVRWDEKDGKPHTCIDATCHIYSIIRRMAEWAEILGEDKTPYERQAVEIKDFINRSLWDEKENFFFDIEAVKGNKEKVKTFEGFWPLALDIAVEDKKILLVRHLTSEKEFFTYHPIPTVSVDEEKFSKNCWRGPAWNGFNFWVIRGCMNSGFVKECRRLAEKVLNATDARFKRYGTIFEFYNSADENMEGMKRKGADRGPCRDYLGHNPLNAIFWTAFNP